jgi:LmbE family N-acetylglucosaminyl deacetylase
LAYSALNSVIEEGNCKKRLLCVTAHPDDEAGSFGGTLLLYHERQVETFVVCLTPGQAASHRGGCRTDAELAEVRRKEFAASCAILEVAEGEVLNYRDGQLDSLDPHGVVGDLVERVRRIQPDVMITYGAEGAVTAHPDHSMASIFATLAYHWAGRTNRFREQLDGLGPHRTGKLYYATANFTLPDRQPVSLAPQTVVLDIGERHLATKIRAFRAHKTQAPLFPLYESTVRPRGHFEFFHLAASTHPGPMPTETDLFAGIE